MRRLLALGTAIVSLVGLPVVARAVSDAPPPLRGAATLTFEADGLDGDAFDNRLAFGGVDLGRLPAADDFATVEIAVPAALLASGTHEVTFVAGGLLDGATAPIGGEQGRDDFLLRDVRIALADGTVVRDPRFDKASALYVGDADTDAAGRSAVEFEAWRGLGSGEHRFLVQREFRFDLDIGATLDDAATLPLVGAYHGRANTRPLRFRTAGPLLPSFPTEEDGENGPTERNVGDAGEREESLPDIGAVRASDGVVATTEVSERFAFQRFEVDASGVNSGHVVVSWTGSTPPGHGVSLWGFDLGSGYYEHLASADKAPDGTTLNGIVDTATMRDEAGVVSLLVTAQRYDQAERPDGGDTDFTMAWITDTQHMAESYPQSFDQTMRWLAGNWQEAGIDYLAHTGDIVENFYEPREWLVASRSYDHIDASGLPYGVLPGNHDNCGGTDQNLKAWPSRICHTLYYAHFGEARFLGKPWYGGSQHNNENHFDTVTAPTGDKFLFLYLANFVDDDEIAWAQQVITDHPDHHVVIAVHIYMDPTMKSRAPDGPRVFNELIVPNDNVFGVIMGHALGAAYTVIRPTEDRIVLELIHDYQDEENGGGGYMRLVRFDLENMQLDMQSWSPVMDEYNITGFHSGRRGHNRPEEYPREIEEYTAPLHLRPVPRWLKTDRLAASPVSISNETP